MKPGLSIQDMMRAAQDLNCDLPAIKAVTAVEAPRGPWNDDGTPTILFERHKFHHFTGGRFDMIAPDLSNRIAGGYGKYSAQHTKLSRAAVYDREAALKSCSWGMFQIMGFNHAIAGHPTLQGFINAMYRSAGDHLDAFVAFVKSQGLADELREHRWADFARRYNGADYARNAYDVKLHQAWLAAGGG
jgi:hypothetical protein